MAKSIKVFLSQPMNGKEEKVIRLEEQLYLCMVKKRLGYNNLERVGWVKEDCGEKGPLFYLAKSIEAMNDADIVVFCPGWEQARGCRIEWEVAREYGKKIVYLG